MATYLELRTLYGNGELLNRIEVGCIVAAEAIRTEDVGTANHANRLIWAKQTFGGSRPVAEKMLMMLLAANKDLSLTAITGAGDEVIQTKIDAAVDIFADGS